MYVTPATISLATREAAAPTVIVLQKTKKNWMVKKRTKNSRVRSSERERKYAKGEKISFLSTVCCFS